MTNTKRWLDELPLDSQERELLMVGKSARPAAGALDANWQAICAAVGTTAASGVALSQLAANTHLTANTVAASAKTGTSLVVSKAAGASLVVAASKSLAVGVAIGLAVMGVSVAVEHSSKNREPSAAPSKPSPKSDAIARARPTPTPIAVNPAPAESIAVAPSPATPSPSSARERAAVSEPTPNSANVAVPAAPPVASSLSFEAKSASLAQQARELAELKRLIDSGAASIALRRLDKDFNEGASSVLSEERDALYAQALARTQRHAEARAFARRFLARYPNSPYVETMRQLMVEQ